MKLNHCSYIGDEGGQNPVHFYTNCTSYDALVHKINIPDIPWYIAWDYL